jgi:hypothetical protein
MRIDQRGYVVDEEGNFEREHIEAVDADPFSDAQRAEEEAAARRLAERVSAQFTAAEVFCAVREGDSFFIARIGEPVA